MIHYVKGDLFTAPEDYLLVHSCNCKGVWGSGVAKNFKEKYFQEYQKYRDYCERGVNIAGSALVINRVGCLFTSVGYGVRVDTPEVILKNTKNAMQHLLSLTPKTLAMPKINSGLFKTPWEDTEAILKTFDRDIYIYTL